MTALKDFERLESTALWRAAPDAQRVEVIVSIGDATLTIADKADRPLSHWSLAAVHRLNPGRDPALFAPSDAPDEAEVLEIDDEQMIDAIEQVCRAILRRRPRRGRVRAGVTAVVIGGLLIGAVTWLPGALTRQTISVLPDVTRAEVGRALLVRLRRVAGPACANREGLAALQTLNRRVLSEPRPRSVVLANLPTPSIHVPGPILVLDASLVEEAEEPDIAAGYLLAEESLALAGDPMLALLREAGLVATVRLLTTGHLTEAVLDRYAEHLLTRPTPALDNAALLARFAAAEVRSTPFAYARDPSGESTLPLIEADPVPLAEAAPLLPDATWVALQNICTE